MIPSVAVVVALALHPGSAPASAQSAPVPAAPAEDTTAARTLEQNRRVLLPQPAQPDARDSAIGAEPPVVRPNRARAAPPAGGGGGGGARVGLAAGAKPGGRPGT